MLQDHLIRCCNVEGRGHRHSQDFLLRCTFLSRKSWRPVLVAALKTHAKSTKLTTSIVQISPVSSNNWTLALPMEVHSMPGVHLHLPPVNLDPIFSPPWGCICTQCSPGYAYGRGGEKERRIRLRRGRRGKQGLGRGSPPASRFCKLPRSLILGDVCCRCRRDVYTVCRRRNVDFTDLRPARLARQMFTWTNGHRSFCAQRVATERSFYDVDLSSTRRLHTGRRRTTTCAPLYCRTTERYTTIDDSPVWGRAPLFPLSIYFLIFSPFYFFLSFIGFTYFLLLSSLPFLPE